MSIETVDTSAIMVTREVRLGAGLPGYEELAEDMTRRGFDPGCYPPEIRAGLSEARARGLTRNPREAALFAIAFAEAARRHQAIERDGSGQSPRRPSAAEDRYAEAARKAARAAAEARAAQARETARIAVETHAAALREAGEVVRRTAYVPEEGRADVARIMVERGLGVGDAFEAWAAEDEPAPNRGGRAGRVGRSG